MSIAPCRSRALGAEGDPELLRFGTGDRAEIENNNIVASIPSGRDAQRRDDAERRSPDGSTPPSRSQGGRAYLAVDMDEGTM
jgi:hypothetical protein